MCLSWGGKGVHRSFTIQIASDGGTIVARSGFIQSSRDVDEALIAHVANLKGKIGIVLSHQKDGLVKHRLKFLPESPEWVANLFVVITSTRCKPGQQKAAIVYLLASGLRMETSSKHCSPVGTRRE